MHLGTERYLLGGRIFTNIGDSILYMLVVWYLSGEFSSPLLLSAAFAGMSTIDAASVLAGPFIDRTGPQENLYGMSLLQGGCAVIFIVFTIFAGLTARQYSVLLLAVLFLTYGASTIIYPSGEKLIPVLVKEEKLVQTNSLFMTTEKVLDTAFNAVSAILISFLTGNTLAWLILLMFILAAGFHRTVFCRLKENYQIRNGKPEEKYSVHTYMAELKTGITEIKKHPDVVLLFLPLTVMNIFYGIAMVGLPVIADRYISSQAYGYGSLLMSSSLGGILGAFLISRFSESIQNPGKYTKIFLLTAGISWLLIPLTIESNFLFSYLLIFISNGAINMMNVMFLSLIQKEIPGELLGRVSTFTESMVSVMVPLGNLTGGFLLSLGYPLLGQILYGVALILCGLPFRQKADS